jgi:hypothetical protein
MTWFISRGYGGANAYERAVWEENQRRIREQLAIDQADPMYRVWQILKMLLLIGLLVLGMLWVFARERSRMVVRRRQQLVWKQQADASRAAAARWREEEELGQLSRRLALLQERRVSAARLNASY